MARPMFDYPLGGVEMSNMRGLLEFTSSEYEGIGPTKSPEELVGSLKAFNTELANRLHDAETVLDMVPA